MRQTRIIRPDYAQRFSCIGSACEDTCCAGWSVTVDEAAYRKYESLPAGPLRSLLDTAIERTPDGAAGSSAPFAAIRMVPEGSCPLLTAERLCRIQVEHGESYLCHTCATFPRSFQAIDGLKEITLSLSCPEAARLVLLDPHFMAPAAGSGYQIAWDETKSGPLGAYFWPIREFVVSLIRNRSYPLWQRLFLLGTFSRRLDALAKGEAGRSVPELLDSFSRAVAARGLCSAMEGIPSDLPLQLEIVLRLVAQRVNEQSIAPRLRRLIEEFAEGVGHRRDASLEEQVARYRDAYTRFYAPFFLARPHILENYLLNTVLRDLFPFGEKLGDPNATAEPARAFAKLAIQFALMKGLLIGVAGFRQREFSSADAVRTIQTAFKYFEHNKRFLSGAYELLESRGLADARGLTMLVRN